MTDIPRPADDEQIPPAPAERPADETPLTADERTEELRPCPNCQGLTGSGAFCEACGAEVKGDAQPQVRTVEVTEARSGAAAEETAEAAAAPQLEGTGSSAFTADTPTENIAESSVAESAPDALDPAEPPAGPDDAQSGGMLVLGAPIQNIPAPTPEAAPAGDDARCECGGGYLDGYCEQCGAPKPDPRDHVEDDAAEWVAGVTDVGIRHQINQDAMALRVDGERAALVVCDGVSTALRSEDASQAAADAAANVLVRATSTGVGVPSSLVPALTSRVAAATDAAADAVADITDAIHAEVTAQGASLGSHANPSCTYVAGVVEAGHVVIGSVGDSRAYWFPDGEAAVRLTTDDSVAEERIAMGTPRAEAETGPGAHTITRWLGIDSPDHSPRSTSLDIDRSGWLILCSDGLWNYASEPDELGAVVADVAAAAVGEAHDAASGAPAADDAPTAESGSAPESALARISPLLLARGLTTWANAKGGHDNITVIAARLHDERKAPTDG